jgi:hypothetical protein
MRALRPDERSILIALIASSDAALLEQLPDAVVQDAGDGTLGIEFVRPVDGHMRFFETVASAEFIDEDGTPVSAALHVDKGGRLMELDFWKADFSRLTRYPTPDQLVMKPRPPTAPPESRWEMLIKLWRDDIPLGDLGNYVARRVAIIVYLGLAWLPLKFLLTIIDALTNGGTGGIAEDGYALWCTVFCLLVLSFIVIAPGAVWRSAAKALAVDQTPRAASINASWFTAGTVLVLVVPAVVFIANCK